MASLVQASFNNSSTDFYSDFTYFYFYKDRYTPYTYSKGQFVTERVISSAFQVSCYINDNKIHDGVIDSFTREYVNGRWVYTFESRGYTLLLGQNEPIPKMNYNVNLTTLANINLDIPHVEYQSATAYVNYIYVKEKSTIWDAISAYSYKAYESFPYIMGTNTVRVTPLSLRTHNYSSAKVVKYGSKKDYRNMISHLFMADVDDNYSASYINTPAAALRVVRKKYYALDRQWLGSPSDGLKFRAKFSNRKYRQQFFTYIGYDNEELFDTISTNTNPYALSNCTVHGIEIVVKDMQILTTVYNYEDGN